MGGSGVMHASEGTVSPWRCSGKAEVGLERYPEFSFDNYMPGDENLQAAEVVWRFANGISETGRDERVLYIAGGEKTGKTHLLKAVISHLALGGKPVLEYDASGFLQVTSVSRDAYHGSLTSLWEGRLPEGAVVAVDDLDALAGPRLDWAWKELTAILEVLHRRSGVAVFAGEEVPVDGKLSPNGSTVPALRDAVVVKLEPADTPTLRIIAQDCFGHGHVSVASDVQEFIAEHAKDVPRLLAVCRLVSVLAGEDGTVGMSTVEHVFKKQGISVNVDARRVTKAAMEDLGTQVPLKDISGRRIGSRMAALRDHIIVELVQKKQLKQKTVAEALGISTQMVSAIVGQAKKST